MVENVHARVGQQVATDDRLLTIGEDV